MSNLSKAAAVAGALVLLILLGVGGYAVAPYIFGGTTGPSPTEVLQRISAEINAELPAQIDKGTRLESTTVDDLTLQYNYTLLPAMAAGLDRASFVADYKSPLQQTVCSKPSLRRLLERGFRVAYRYRLEDDTAMGEFVFEEADCSA